MEYMSAPQAAENGAFRNDGQILCSQNCIPGVSKLGYMWLIPKDAKSRLTGEQNRERSYAMNKVLIIEEDDKEICFMIKDHLKNTIIKYSSHLLVQMRNFFFFFL